MSCDPCAGHACDGCAICRSGTYCLTASVDAPATASVPDDIALLRQAIAEDASTRSLSDLIQAESVTGPVGLTSLIQSDSIRDVLGRPAVRTPVRFTAGRDLPPKPAEARLAETPALTAGADPDSLFHQTSTNERSSNVHIPRRHG
jgi:hypothetical protein